MLIRALHDIWDALREYNTQALKIAALAVLFYLAASLCHYLYSKSKGRKVSFIRQVPLDTCLFGIISVYLSYLVFLTLSGREAYSRSEHVNLRVFSTLFSASGGSLKLTGIENVILFIPFGILVPYMWSFFRHWWNLSMMAFVLSTSIETLQLATGRGYFEIDDILLNVAGAIIGYFMFALLYYSSLGGRKRFYEDHINDQDKMPYHEYYAKRRDLINVKKLDEVNLFLIQLLPILLVIQMIFKFSADTGDQSSELSRFVTEKLLSIISYIFDRGKETAIQGYDTGTDIVARWEPLVRKAAHVCEYALLGFFTYIFFYCRKLKVRTVLIVSMCFCLFTAICDELNQMSVPDRNGAARDVLIDFSGSVLMIGFMYLVYRLILFIHKNKIKGQTS
ncbi:MAG: VanZ family protein [Lachnospiraceae bacterium]|nr:VanZ family protein [Lachnospiraceae bacterium]